MPRDRDIAATVMLVTRRACRTGAPLRVLFVRALASSAAARAGLDAMAASH